MSGVHCHRCGSPLAEGSPKYEVAVRVRSVFDGVIPDRGSEAAESEIERLVRELSQYSEEELNRQVYEDDVFIMCPRCKEAFLETIYSHIHRQATPESGRAHLVH